MPALLTIGLVLVLGVLTYWLWARERSRQREVSRKADIVTRCEAGESATCLAAGQRLERRGLARHAEEVYGRCCKAAQPSCCFNVGLLRWRRGDRVGARPLLRRACERGHARGCTNLGALLLEQGETDEGIVASRRACERSQALGCRNLAFALLMKGDVAKARAPALEACNLGAPLGCLVRCHVRLLGRTPATKEDRLRCYQRLLAADERRRALSRASIVAELKRLSATRESFRSALASVLVALGR